MIGMLAVLLAGTAVGLHGHRPLLWLAERRVDPTILLVGWSLLSIGLVASTLAMIGLLALPMDEHEASGLFQLVGGCWTAVTTGTVPAWQQTVAGISLIMAATILVRLGKAITSRLRSVRRHAPHVEQLRLLAMSSSAGEPLWVPGRRAMALSIGGRPGVIIASDGLRAHLPPEAVAATLEHERAHLRGHHHALVTVAETLAAALPWCPLLGAAPAAIRDLVELAADDQAARRCGPEAVQVALRRMTGQPVPPFGLAMASRLTELRISRLATSDPQGARHLLRWPGAAAMAAGTLLLPAATTWLGINVVLCAVT
ncbi:M56 family metallopeptidase [uncultured Modestobacter sp.]|uniref:M56 family metallopeptidase n=1 Tax=uncultured Modestobacter sp. TaxID=380048 RepID=UPI00263310DE|nr:M56 family metallopeptidase [uncultured Modestobacter sp.]